MDETWVYVVVQDPGGNERFVGQEDLEKKISFIPCFLTKEAAQQCLFRLTLDKTRKYEVQAIIFEDLRRHAKENGFLIYQLDDDGKIIHMI